MPLLLAVQGGFLFRSSAGKPVADLEDYKIATALPGFNVTLVSQQSIGMFHRYSTDANLVCNDSFGWQLGIVRIDALNDILPDLLI